MRVRAGISLVTATIAAFAGLGLVAPSANACMGPACDAICGVWHQVRPSGCPIA